MPIIDLYWISKEISDFCRSLNLLFCSSGKVQRCQVTPGISIYIGITQRDRCV